MHTLLDFINKKELASFLLNEGFNDYMVIDEKVKSHLPKELLESKRIFWISDPESHKNIVSYNEIVEYFLDRNISRSSKIIGIGGGATTDLTGFVAATILRGVKWISIPTTLLGMVDGAIGGKVAINTKHGKNLIGSFHNPEKVILCTEFLDTLKEEQFSSGKGEIMKYCFLNKNIFESVINHNNLDEIVKACAEYKKTIVENDFKENDRRMLLNFGHTFGHCYESHFKMPHGLAVIYGIRDIIQIFSPELEDDFNNLLSVLNIKLDLNLKIELKDLTKILIHDKKRRDNIYNLIIIKNLGEGEILSISQEELKRKIESYFE